MSGWTILPEEVYNKITQKCPSCEKATQQAMDGDLAINVSCKCGWQERLILRSELAQGVSNEYYPPLSCEEEEKMIQTNKEQGILINYGGTCIGFKAKIPTPKLLPK